jgi:hypothetical protein
MTQRNPEAYRRSPEQYQLMVKKRIESNNRTFAERFWKRVKIGEPDGCWPWTGQITNKGYGTIYKGRPIGTHRIAWELANGHIEGGLYVLHKCDNRACCNPKHLFLGTHLDNMRDMSNKGRSHKTKLTKIQAVEILERYKTGKITQGQLSREYGVHKCTIQDLVRGKTWLGIAR